MKKENGFTLIELMITLAVLVILLMIGIPSFIGFLSNNRMITTTNNVIAGFQAARSEAITRRVPVILCQNNGSGTGCASGGLALTNGWIIGTDTDGDGVINEVIRATNAFPSGMTFTFTGFNASFVNYSTGGLTTNITTPTSIRICDSNRTGESGRDIIINATGGVSVSPTIPTCS